MEAVTIDVASIMPNHRDERPGRHAVERHFFVVTPPPRWSSGVEPPLFGGKRLKSSSGADGDSSRLTEINQRVGRSDRVREGKPYTAICTSSP